MSCDFIYEQRPKTDSVCLNYWWMDICCRTLKTNKNICFYLHICRYILTVEWMIRYVTILYFTINITDRLEIGHAVCVVKQIIAGVETTRHIVFMKSSLWILHNQHHPCFNLLFGCFAFAATAATAVISTSFPFPFYYSSFYNKESDSVIIKRVRSYRDKV